MKRTAIKKVFKFTLMIAIAKHGIFSLGKAKELSHVGNTVKPDKISRTTHLRRLCRII